MPNQRRGTFPSNTQKNPIDCMEIQLRSGKDLSSNKKTEREEETEAEKEETEKEGEKNSQIEQPKGSNDQKKKEGVRPEKIQFLEKWQNRNFDFKIVISVKNPELIL